MKCVFKDSYSTKNKEKELSLKVDLDA